MLKIPRPFLPLLSLLALAALCAAPLRAQDSETKKSNLPAPTHAAVAYGPHPRNIMDVWLAKSDRPTPLLVYFHGGGFITGSKENLPASLLNACLRAGISVAASNYRLAPEVVLPTPYLDCARALQFARHAAREWNIDPARVALTGSSAGAATSLWIAFHDDLAEPQNADAIARESTRVRCAVVSGAQPSYDPRVIARVAGEAAARHRLFTVAYGLKPDELDSDKAHQLYALASPLTYLTREDPPVFAYYSEARTPVPPNAAAGQGIHHPNLGLYLKEKMDGVGVPCVLRHKDQGGSVVADEIAFLKQYLVPEAAVTQ